MRKPEEITDRHKDLREMESLYWLSNGPTDRVTDRLMQRLWKLWNAGSLKLEVWGSLTMRVWTDKRRERAAYSITGPLALCGFIQRNDNHFWLLLCLADTFLTILLLLVNASVEKGQVESTAQVFLLHTQIRGLNTCNILSLKLLFCVTLPMRIQKAGLIWGTAECRPFPQQPVSNPALKIALMSGQFTQMLMWLMLYAHSKTD